jgi:hypothetical protein
MPYERGIHLRPDWETVIEAVVDFAINPPTVDPGRIVLDDWSLGGHLAPRAASGGHRLAACVADQGQWSIAGEFRNFAIKPGATPEAAADLGELGQSVLNRPTRAIVGSPSVRWKILQRGFWVHGVDNPRDYLRFAEQFTMDGRPGRSHPRPCWP